MIQKKKTKNENSKKIIIFKHLIISYLKTQYAFHRFYLHFIEQ